MNPYIHNVKYYETDQMAIVHHSNYIRWFEEARIDWMEQLGLSYARMEQRGLIMPVLGVSAQYKTMCRFGDNVAVVVRLTEYNGIRLRCAYEVSDAASGEVRCTGTSEHCVLNEKGRIVNLRRAAPDLHEAFRAQLEQQD